MKETIVSPAGVEELNEHIAMHNATITSSTHSIPHNEMYYRGSENHCSGSVRIWGNFATGWNENVAQIDKKPTSEILAPAIDATNGIFIGMVSIKPTGVIEVYNSTNSSKTNISVGFIASW